MTEERKPDASSSPSFAETVRELDLVTKIMPGGPVSDGVVILLACIREQQAALEGVIRVADRATVEFDAARNALARWRLK